MSRLSDLRLAGLIYLLLLGAYGATSAGRLQRPSSDTHFVYQAKMFLERRLDLGRPPPNQNDWAEVEYLELRDGRTVAGSFLRAQPYRFRTLGGRVEMVRNEDIKSRSKKYYVSFPPLPAVLMMPLVRIWGMQVNDVLFTLLLAPLAPALLFLALRRLSARGDSARSRSEDLWLTAMFGLGTIYYYSSILGQVWYTAHVVAAALTGCFLLASLEARHPILAGLCLGGIVLTRPQMGVWGLFFLWEAWRARATRPLLRSLVAVSLPVAALGAAGAWFNWARFHALGEFGHSYLNVRWTNRIQRYGLLNYAFLSRNLTCAFTLTPKLIGKPPYLKVSWHGMSMLITTPALIYLLWPRVKGGLHWLLWAIVTPVALLSFLYQNDGWVQFGYRFSNDYLIALILLLAIGGQPLGRTWKALILVGIAVNLFGAITFGRMWQFYHDGFFPIGPGEL